VTAQSFGVNEGLLAEVLDDLESSSLDEKLKPILIYAKQLTLEASKSTQAQVDAILAAGWSEQALHDAVNVICLFNFMNRLVEGHGIKGSANLFQERGEALKDGGYDPLLKFLE
jgi:alkylhydroperoxidase family enzyme